jgi:PAS domain S-box-containing protein
MGTLMPWLGLAVVLISLSMGVMDVVDQQRKQLLTEAQRHAEDDIGLIHVLVQDALQGQNYQLIDDLLKQWGEKRRDIEELILTTANDFTLGRYRRASSAIERYRVTREVPYSYRGRATLILVKDLRSIGEGLAQLRAQLFIGVVGVGIVLGLLIWLGLRWRAEVKVLRARTRALDEAKEAIKNEMFQHSRAEERFRNLFESVPNAIVIVNRQGEISMVNAHTEKLFGYPREALIRQPVNVLVPERFRDKHAEYQKGYFAQPLTKPMGVGRDLLALRKDGSEVPVEIALKPIVMDAGTVVLVVMVDITERSRVQQELARHRERLEELVVERTAELKAAQQELIRKQSLATLGQLTATVSHELRNPLGTLRASIYYLGNQVRDKDLGVGPALERAERNIQRCDDIITELLDYTRIQGLKLESTQLDGWLAELLSEAAIPAQITLRQRLQAPVEVALDRDWFRRGVVNVLDNACQALAEFPDDDGRERLLTVKTIVLLKRVEILFEDHGPGIPAEVKAHVFEPLFSTKGFGVGLGLCIVKQIMERHGGGVKISSEPGQGTCVRLWLPR